MNKKILVLASCAMVLCGCIVNPSPKPIPNGIERQLLLGGFQYHWSKLDPAKYVTTFTKAKFDGIDCELIELIAGDSVKIGKDEAMRQIRSNIDKMTKVLEQCSYNGAVCKITFVNSNADFCTLLNPGDLERLLDYAMGQWSKYLDWALILPVSENDRDLASNLRANFIRYAEQHIPKKCLVKMNGNEGSKYAFIETHLQKPEEIGRGLPKHWSSLVVTDSGAPIRYIQDGSIWAPNSVNPANCRYIAERNYRAGYSFSLYWFAEASDKNVSEAIKLVGALHK